MGNRAIITNTATNNEPRSGLYLHWNGSPETVFAILEAARQSKIRTPVEDPTYCFARMAQLVGNWDKGTTGMGAGLIDHMDDGDNGIYEVDDNWKVISRSKEGPISIEALNESERKVYQDTLSAILKANEGIF